MNREYYPANLLLLWNSEIRLHKNCSYSSSNLRRILCVDTLWNTGLAKHLTLCFTTISTQQASLPQIKTLYPLSNKQQWIKPTDSETELRGIVSMPIQTNVNT